MMSVHPVRENAWLSEPTQKRISQIFPRILPLLFTG